MLTINFLKKETPTLEKVIAELEEYLLMIGPDHENYTKLSKELNALYASKKGNSRPHVDPSVLIQAGAGIVAVLLILHYERLGVVTSKALSFVKLR